MCAIRKTGKTKCRWHGHTASDLHAPLRSVRYVNYPSHVVHHLLHSIAYGVRILVAFREIAPRTVRVAAASIEIVRLYFRPRRLDHILTRLHILMRKDELLLLKRTAFVGRNAIYSRTFHDPIIASVLLNK